MRSRLPEDFHDDYVDSDDEAAGTATAASHSAAAENGCVSSAAQASDAAGDGFDAIFA
jgi:hypothetical protein